MKKNFYYLLSMMMVAMLCVGFTSCGDDDDDDDVPGGGSATLVGTWKIIETAGYTADGDLYVKTTESEFSYPMYYQFKANGTAAYFEYYQGDWDVDRGTYTYNNNTIIVDGEKMEVLSLTSTELKVKFDDENPNVSYVIVTMKKVKDSDVPNAEDYDDDDDYDDED